MNTHLEKYLRAQQTDKVGSDLDEHAVQVPEPWLIEDRLGADQVAQLAADYLSGTTSRTLAERFRVSKTAVVDMLKRQGIPIRPPGPRSYR